MSIIGHQKIISFFERMIDKNSLSQSYCFVGANQMGKRTVARYLSARLLKIDEKKLDTHPDFYYLARQIDEKTDKLNKYISAAQAKQIKIRLGGKSWFGGYQAVIIDEAEKLNEEAGNALLKLLEGTAGQRVIFLLTTDDNALLPTIRSRCQMFYFLPVENKEIEDGLIKSGTNPALAAEAALLSWGRPGRAAQLAGEENYRKSVSGEIVRWQNIINQPFFKKLKSLEDLLDSKTDSLRAGEKLSDAIETWSVLWRNKMLEKVLSRHRVTLLAAGAKSENDSGGLSARQIAALINSFNAAKSLLAQNVNPKLVAEQILLSLP